MNTRPRSLFTFTMRMERWRRALIKDLFARFKFVSDETAMVRHIISAGIESIETRLRSKESHEVLSEILETERRQKSRVKFPPPLKSISLPKARLENAVAGWVNPSASVNCAH